MEKAMVAYYNEHNPTSAKWLRLLIENGLIAPGEVDDRSIEDVTPSELSGYSQHHFFAGIGGWSLALRLAGWSDSRPVWTGSCPCQPFSAAGKSLGFDDERHLWPSFEWLIRQCHPATVYGEQVARKAGREWLAVVRSDLETTGYAMGAADIPACAVGAWHERPRHYWVAHSIRVQQRRQEPCRRTAGRMGRLIKSVSWDRGWQEALRELRSMDDGLSYGVGLTDGFRNAIVPPLAQAYVECTM
ncbi:DNA cytosine methyltransferase [Phaeobacter sp. JH204B]|uniref:DNA cytosine methyltransferase n=1 Tax=Phaeobacter sp. JH204B TaxID=3112503 RepID=UPI003A87D184